ncbi:MAG: Holliday junction resolvase RuvX [Dehalococcoidia bacterium]|nr:Holliday junction resolvase RuvX [Dehalococcoidia bacterium]
MPILALDIGEKRTGLAISNDVSTICTPLKFISSENIDLFLTELKKILVENKIKKIIVGLPILLSGKEGTRAKFSRYISKRIKKANKNVDVILWDERLSTKEAEKYLIKSGLSKSKIKDKIDSASAVIILESYILGKQNG